MTTRARGTFQVTLAPQPEDGYTDGQTLGRMTIDPSGGKHRYVFEYTLDGAAQG